MIEVLPPYLPYTMGLRPQTEEGRRRIHVLPELPYKHDALEPYIDTETMHLHHDMHHAGYVKALNASLADFPDLQRLAVEEMVSNLETIPEAVREEVRNHGGGHLNHSLFWSVMRPNANPRPPKPLAEVLRRSFGGVEEFKRKFNEMGAALFGSGWVWMVVSPQGRLELVTTPNQDNPISQGYLPIVGNDLWEHAYYLRHRNRRAEYLEVWWKVVDWEEVHQRYVQAMALRNERAG